MAINKNKKRFQNKREKFAQQKNEMKEILTIEDVAALDQVNVVSSVAVVKDDTTKISKKRKLSSSDNEDELSNVNKCSKLNEECSDLEEIKIKAPEIKKVLKSKKKVKLDTREQGKRKNLEMLTNKMISVKEMLSDTPQLTDEVLVSQIRDRLLKRMSRTMVINNCPAQFSASDALTLVPDMVSCQIPYNFYYHKVEGAVYIDVATSELATTLAKKLNKSDFQSRKIHVKVQNKIVEDVNKYNCNRLVISNLPIKANEAEINQVLPTAIRIEIMPTKGNDLKSTKTAFAEYSRVEDAVADYDSKHGYFLNGHAINIKFQIRNNDNVKTKMSNFDKKRLKVYGLKPNTPLNDLKKTFPQAVGILPVLDKGFATIVYTNEDECYVDKSNADAAKPNKNWKIGYAHGNVIISDKEPSISNLKEDKVEIKEDKVEIKEEKVHVKKEKVHVKKEKVQIKLRGRKFLEEKDHKRKDSSEKVGEQIAALRDTDVTNDKKQELKREKNRLRRKRKMERRKERTLKFRPSELIKDKVHKKPKERKV